MSANNSNFFGAKLRNAPSNVANYVRGSNKLVMGLITIFVVIVIGMVVYWIYQAYEHSRGKDDMNPVLVPGAVNAFDETTFTNSGWTIPDSGNSNSPSMAFSISFWMYITSWDYRLGDPKTILLKGSPSSPGNAAPAIVLGGNDNTLRIRMRTYKARPDGKPGAHEGCDVANIPLQKWVHVGYVLDNRVTDVYINGKLERSCVLQRLPWLNNQKLWLVPPGANNQYGFFGQLSSVRYFSSALRPVDIARLYNEGPHATKGWTSKSTPQNASPSHGLAPTCPPVHPGTAPVCHGGSVPQLKQDVTNAWDSL